MTERSLDVIGEYSPNAPDTEALRQVRNMLAREMSSGDAFIVDTVPNMVQRIERSLGSGLRLRRLRIFGHGSPGVQCVGRLMHSRWDVTGAIVLSLSDSIRLIMGRPGSLTNDPPLGSLRNRFAPGGWTELHGCRVAEGAAGEALLRALAMRWGVMVKGGASLQYPAGGIEGPVVIAEPNGTIRRQ